MDGRLDDIVPDGGGQESLDGEAGHEEEKEAIGGFNYRREKNYSSLDFFTDRIKEIFE